VSPPALLLLLTIRFSACEQVHGYDLTCVDLLGGIEHRLVSGADEKTLRVFDATNKVLGLLRELCGIESASPARTETAYVPALGLSNKAVTLRPEDEEEDEQGKGREAGAGGENDDGEAISKARSRVTWRGPPLEQELVDHTLWPEVQKLYGHVNGLTALTASASGGLLASACKARDAKSAVLRLWDTATWRCVGALPGHQSTVVQLAFTHDDAMLVSVSRDRQICVFAADAETGAWGLVKAYPKAHKRIIWSCSWSHDDALLATGSRDGVVKLWRREGRVGLQEACSFEPLSKGSDGTTSVTAVAFLPRPPVFSAEEYVLAVGLECGEIELWAGGAAGATPWRRLGTLLETQAHASTVRRLRWKPQSGAQGAGEAVLASCGGDHAVRVTTVEGL
jgi:elongator complex protein 2